MAEVDGSIKEIGDRLVGLTLKEAVDLGDYLKEEYGIEPASAGVAVAAAPGGGGGEAAEAEEQTEFDVLLNSAGENKIKVIKVVRETTGLGLKEAKEMVDSLPATLQTGISREDADAMAEKVKEVGGEVEIK